MTSKKNMKFLKKMLTRRIARGNIKKSSARASDEQTKMFFEN